MRVVGSSPGRVKSFYAPNFEKVGSILLSACPCVCVSVCAFVRPFKKKIQARVLKFHIWIPHQKIAYPYFFSCPNYLPLPSYEGLKVQICNHDISKTITARSFKLGQLIEDDE